MLSSNDVLARARSTNPVATVDTISDDLLMEVAALIENERRDIEVISLKTSQTQERDVRDRRSWRPVAAFAAAFALTIAAVGAVAVFSALNPESGDVADDPAPISTTTLPPAQDDSAPSEPAVIEAIASGPVTIEFENLTGHTGDGLSGLLQRRDPESSVDPSTGILTDNVASFAVEVDADPFSTSQVLRDITLDSEDHTFSEPWRYLGGEASIPVGIYRLTVWVGPEYCCFLYSSPPEVPAQRCQMWVTVTGEGQTVHVKHLGGNGVHCNPDEPLEPLP